MIIGNRECLYVYYCVCSVCMLLLVSHYYIIDYSEQSMNRYANAVMIRVLYTSACNSLLMQTYLYWLHKVWIKTLPNNDGTWLTTFVSALLYNLEWWWSLTVFQKIDVYQNISCPTNVVSIQNESIRKFENFQKTIQSIRSKQSFSVIPSIDNNDNSTNRHVKAGDFVDK